MGSQKNKWILLVSFAILFIVLVTPLNRLAFFFGYKASELTAEDILSVDEINDFMKVWSKFMRSDISRSLDLVSLNSNGETPAQVSRWVNAQGWSAKRFFDIEQRLRELVKIANLQNNLASNIKMQQASKGRDLSTIIENQKKYLETVQYNQQELEIVSANLYQISQVLDGKAVVE